MWWSIIINNPLDQIPYFTSENLENLIQNVKFNSPIKYNHNINYTIKTEKFNIEVKKRETKILILSFIDVEYYNNWDIFKKIWNILSRERILINNIDREIFNYIETIDNYTNKLEEALIKKNIFIEKNYIKNCKEIKIIKIKKFEDFDFFSNYSLLR